MIPEELYKQILSVIPIICVDIVIRNDKGQYLLVQRKNEPLKGDWWVVGGRILQGETASNACIRKTLEEIGLAITDVHFLGIYEDIFDKNSFEVPGPYHTISIVFEACITVAQTIQLDSQHSDWGWFDNLPDRFVYVLPTRDAVVETVT
jgi:colanic acid biosynthesis protein WcaH